MIVERRTLETIGGSTKEISVFEDFNLAVELPDSGRTIHILYPPTLCYRLIEGVHMNSWTVSGPISLPFVRAKTTGRKIGC